jgi:hypothetical protein
MPSLLETVSDFDDSQNFQPAADATGARLAIAMTTKQPIPKWRSERFTGISSVEEIRGETCRRAVNRRNCMNERRGRAAATNCSPPSRTTTAMEPGDVRKGAGVWQKRNPASRAVCRF